MNEQKTTILQRQHLSHVINDLISITFIVLLEFAIKTDTSEILKTFNHYLCI